jgi:hypothetical protein
VTENKLHILDLYMQQKCIPNIKTLVLVRFRPKRKQDISENNFFFKNSYPTWLSADRGFDLKQTFQQGSSPGATNAVHVC